LEPNLHYITKYQAKVVFYFIFYTNLKNLVSFVGPLEIIQQAAGVC